MSGFTVDLPALEHATAQVRDIERRLADLRAAACVSELVDALRGSATAATAPSVASWLHATLQAAATDLGLVADRMTSTAASYRHADQPTVRPR